MRACVLFSGKAHWSDLSHLHLCVRNYGIPAVFEKTLPLPEYSTDYEGTRGICKPIDAIFFEAQLQQD